MTLFLVALIAGGTALYRTLGARASAKIAPNKAPAPDAASVLYKYFLRTEQNQAGCLVIIAPTTDPLHPSVTAIMPAAWCMVLK